MNKNIEKQKFEGKDWKLEIRVRSVRKLREDSTWNRLEPEQLKMFEGWLFVENLGYAKIVERVKKEFGVESTIASVARYYRRRKPEKLLEARISSNGLNDLPVSADSVRTATLKLAGKAALNLAGETPEEIERLTSLAEALLQAEQNDLRRARLKLAEKNFDHDATAATVQELPRIRAYLQAIVNDTSLSGDETMKKIQALLFHWERSEKQQKKVSDAK